MSQENVEIVRRFVECWRLLDWDAVAALVGPAVEQHPTVGGVEQRVLRGVGEIRADYETVEELWDEHRIEMDVEAAVFLDLRDGRIVRLQGYPDRDAALAAA